MDNTMQLYMDENKEIKGYPITSPDRVIDENGVNIKDYVDEAINNAKLEGEDVQIDLSAYAKKTDLHDHSNKTILDGITTSKVNQWDNKSDFSGSYNDLTNKPTIPTKVSELTNDKGYLTSIPNDYVTDSELNSKGYLTEHQDISGKVDRINGYSLVSDAEISRLETLENYDDTEVRELIDETNMSLKKNIKFEVVGEGTTVPPISGGGNDYDDTEIKNALNSKADKTELHSHSNKNVLDEITSNKVTEWDNKSNFSGNYNDLSNKPTIPTKTSQLTNDSGFITAIPSEYITESELNSKGYLTKHQDLSAYALQSNIPTKVSQLSNDSGYLKDIPGEYITETELTTEISKLKSQGIQQTPLFVQSVAECTDTTKIYVLPDGYVYAYIYTEKVIPGSSYKNWLPLATETYNGSTIYGGVGYASGYRLSSSGSPSAQSGMFATGFIPATTGAIIRTEGFKCTYAPMGCYVITYNSSGTKLNHYQWSTTDYTTGDNYIKQFTLDSTTYGSGVAYIRISAVTSTTPTIVTVNEEIKVNPDTVIKEYAWASTGHAFIPTNYEDRIIELEKEVETLKIENNELKNSKSNSLGISEVFAPSPQLPADGSSGSDFNAETISCTDIYNYIEPLVVKYPKYITKETMGKDASGLYDWNRYTLCKRYYDAWQKVNYPKMYGWTNGSTTIYSTSVSPRIGDTLYTTTYVGTSKGTVTAVSNANQTRTVGGVVYTRNSSKDIEPTLVYTETYYSPYYVGGYANFRNYVYNSTRSTIGTIATYSKSTMTDSKGTSYVRYPMGDRNADFEKPQVLVIGSNEHGRPQDPAEPAIISSRMIKDLCECVNANNPFLNLLKNNYMLVFCPLINPWGFSNAHKSYYNSNGINIDRNFDTIGWGNDTTSGLQGSYGGSENETQYFMNTIVESGAKIVTANHGLGTHTNDTTGESVNAGLCHYMLGRNNAKYTDSLNSIGMIMSANYNLSFTDYGEAPPETYGKTRSYIASVGAEGGAVEMQGREGFIKEGNGKLHTSRILEANYTLLLQFLYMLIDKSV